MIQIQIHTLFLTDLDSDLSQGKEKNYLFKGGKKHKKRKKGNDNTISSILCF